MPPRIGLTTYLDPIRHLGEPQEAAFTPADYIEAVVRSGGTPVLLPPSPAEPGSVLDLLDGLVVIGGSDVDPSVYGQEPDPRAFPPRPRRDAWEIALCLGALEMDLPLLAVCRGIQVLNVALGGTLHQHIDHHMAPDHLMTPYEMKVEPGSRLAGVVSESCRGLCHHHQAIDGLGGGLTVTARAPDGTVEAVEVVDKGFALGVQWHPERDPGDDRLFQALVEAGRNRRFFP